VDMFSTLTDAVAASICQKLERNDPESIAAVREIIAPEVARIIESFKTTAAKKI